MNQNSDNEATLPKRLALSEENFYGFVLSFLSVGGV